MTKNTPWTPGCDSDVVAALDAFYADLPGWWLSFGRCSVTCHASCGPDRLHIQEPILSDFDEGYHADVPNPTTLAAAINNVREQALAGLAAYQTTGVKPDLRSGWESARATSDLLIAAEEAAA